MEKMPYQAHLEPALPPATVHTPATTSSDWRTGLPCLTGSLVSLRGLRASDAPALFAALTSEQVSRFISPSPATIDGFGASSIGRSGRGSRDSSHASPWYRTAWIRRSGSSRSGPSSRRSGRRSGASRWRQNIRARAFSSMAQQRLSISRLTCWVPIGSKRAWRSRTNAATARCGSWVP